VKLLCSFRCDLKGCFCCISFTLQIGSLIVCENGCSVDARSRCRVEGVTWNRRLAELGTVGGAVSAATFLRFGVPRHSQTQRTFFLEILLRKMAPGRTVGK